MNEYLVWKKLEKYEHIENEQVVQQVAIVNDMVELLPAKLDKLSAHLAAQRRWSKKDKKWQIIRKNIYV